MDGSTVAAVASGVGVGMTAIMAFATARTSSKDRQERQADRQQTEAAAGKLQAEKEEITQRASSLALTNVQSELTRVRTDLDHAYEDATKLRDTLRSKNDQIDEQDRTIRALTRKAEDLQEQNKEQAVTIRRLIRRSETVEEWIKHNCDRFGELGITELPTDSLGDRHRHDNHDEEEAAQAEREETARDP